MNYESIYLSRKELRRFLEIANGDTTAKNTPEEDALFREKLAEERMFAITRLVTGKTSADYRAVVLSDRGKEYYAQYMNQQKKTHKDDWHYWIGTIIAIASIVVSIILAMQQVH